MRLPIQVLKEIGKKYGYSVVVVYAYDDSKKIQHIASWGKSMILCDQAAQWADKLKDALGWPESLHAMPNRVKKLQDQLNKLKEFHPRAFKLMKKKKNFIVVAVDEPYFRTVYELIRATEINKGTWTDQDELFFNESCEFNRELLISEENHDENKN